MEMFCYNRLSDDNGHLAGRQLLAAMYQQLTGKELPEIRYGERGKPYFPNDEWFFSISHTKNHVFCAISKNEIGIDAEELNRKVNLSIAKKILSQQEFAEFDGETDKSQAILKFWVMKEAYLKYIGTGLTGFPNGTNFSISQTPLIFCDGCVIAVYEKEGFSCSLIPTLI